MQESGIALLDWSMNDRGIEEQCVRNVEIKFRCFCFLMLSNTKLANISFIPGKLECGSGRILLWVGESVNWAWSTSSRQSFLAFFSSKTKPTPMLHKYCYYGYTLFTAVTHVVFSAPLNANQNNIQCVVCSGFIMYITSPKQWRGKKRIGFFNFFFFFFYWKLDLNIISKYLLKLSLTCWVLAVTVGHRNEGVLCLTDSAVHSVFHTTLSTTDISLPGFFHFGKAEKFETLL